MFEGALEGRTAIVMGAGRGIGRALALALAEAGADVALAARSSGEIGRVATEVEERGRRALAVPTDVANDAEVERLVGHVLEELGDLYIFVNNSGVIYSAPLLETSPEEWDRVMATNLRGMFLCMHAAGWYFVGQQEGKVVNVASHFTFMSVPRFASYSASKAGVVNLTRAAAVEWVSSGVRVNAIATGYVEAEMNAALRSDEKLKAKVVGQIPAYRMACTEELGPLVVYLASLAYDFMIGETLVFDGGQTVK
jgi:NAD(P)-dependent dehydrogenase (short-subunit alcohol dehydrogenase family)